MPTYTVHAPPARNGVVADPQRFEFVRDGFHFWAFLIAPLWLLYRRLWLTLLGYAVLVGLIEVGFHLLKLPEGARLVIDLLIGLLVGLEAATLRRWTYGRRKWTTAGIVTAANQEEAEYRFFTQWAERGDEQSMQPAAPPPPSTLARPADTEVLGLFPQPGGRS